MAAATVGQHTTTGRGRIQVSSGAAIPNLAETAPGDDLGQHKQGSTRTTNRDLVNMIGVQLPPAPHPVVNIWNCWFRGQYL